MKYFSIPIIFALSFCANAESNEICTDEVNVSQVLIEKDIPRSKVCITTLNTWAELDYYDDKGEYTGKVNLESMDSLDAPSCEESAKNSKIELVAACALDSRPGCKKEKVCVRITY